jgi:histidine kinase
MADAKQVALTVDVDDASELVVDGDPDRLSQAVANLVTNPVTYTPSGGTVAVVVRGDDRNISIQVTDTGVGLEGDDSERVCDRFYRVEGVARPPGGSGIGLAITRAIVRAHGGDVSATSAGRALGATFTVRLPRRRGALDP